MADRRRATGTKQTHVMVLLDTVRPLRHLIIVVGLMLTAVTGRAQSPQLESICRVDGRITGAGTALPGVAIAATAGDGTRWATSTATDGTYRLSIPRGAYAVVAELVGFTAVERTVDLDVPQCDQVVDLTLTLIPAGQQARPPVVAATPAHDTDVAHEAPPPSSNRFGRDAFAAAIAVRGNETRFSPVVRRPMDARGGAETRIGGRIVPPNAGRTTAEYVFGGSALDHSPFRLRPDALVDEQPYSRHTFGINTNRRLRLPGSKPLRPRSTLFASYNGTRGRTLFDRYGTVPTDAMRAGDFSTSSIPLVDPNDGAPFPGNRIPIERISDQARGLLSYVPHPNLPGTTNNYHRGVAASSFSDAVSLRIMHTLTTSPASMTETRAPDARAVPPFGGRITTQTNIVLTGQIQYRRDGADLTNVFSTLGGRTIGRTLHTPITLNAAHRVQLHSLEVQPSWMTSATINGFANQRSVAGDAGIQGTSAEPLAWGVPALMFSSVSAIHDVVPSQRHDRRLGLDYAWSRPTARHSPRVGATLQLERLSTRTDPNANGAFVFTGLHTSGGAPARPGFDVADFLLGLPQQASVQYGPGTITVLGRSLALFAQDDWRVHRNLTLALGLRYEVLWPYVESHGRSVNLDVAPDFSAAAPVVSGARGPFSGAFPSALLFTDTNNIAPRMGVAWRGGSGLVVRGGYGVSYNGAAYAGFARQLSMQPPFAVTNTRIGTVSSPLRLADALTGASATLVTNTLGVDKRYALGRVQTWNVDVERSITALWTMSASYTQTWGSSLDVVRAPNRGPNGLRIPDVQSFLWQTSEGASLLHSGRFLVQRRQARGIAGSASYILARSRDNAPSIGGGTIVAQDDRDLDAEWGLSNFDRRHRLRVELSAELPFGSTRRWLRDGGPWTGVFGDWSVAATYVADAGTPLTPRVRAATRDVAQGVSGALRADYDGEPIGLDHPTVDRFFNVSAFSVPPEGRFGQAARNVIIGPGLQQLDARLSRDVRWQGQRVMTIELRVTNLLNRVNYLNVDAFVNSPSFGHVLSARPMRSSQLAVRIQF